jgi:hypothetical protein
MSHQRTSTQNVDDAGALMHTDISEADGYFLKTASETYEGVKINRASAVNPGTGDDSGSGYSIGSYWFNTTADTHWVCLDATGAAAVWKETTAAGSGIANVVEDTSPQWGGNMDPNGNAFWDETNELLEFVETGSALNHFSIAHAAAGNGPILGIGVTGTEANVDINITAKGTGDINLNNPVVLGGALQLGGQVDVNGQVFGDGTNTLLGFVEDASAVNFIEIENQATGATSAGNAIIRGTGSDTDAGINFQSKGVGVFKFEGNVVMPVRTETGATYSILLSDFVVLADCTAQNQTISLPAIPEAGVHFVVKRIDATANTVDVDTADAATIDGDASVGLNSEDSMDFLSDGTNWYIM